MCVCCRGFQRFGQNRSTATTTTTTIKKKPTINVKRISRRYCGIYFHLHSGQGRSGTQLQRIHDPGARGAMFLFRRYIYFISRRVCIVLLLISLHLSKTIYIYNLHIQFHCYIHRGCLFAHLWQASQHIGALAVHYAIEQIPIPPTADQIHPGDDSCHGPSHGCSQSGLLRSRDI